MEAKDYLLQLKKNEAMTVNALQEIERLKTMAAGMSGSAEGERVQASKSADKMGNAVIRYIELEEDLQQKTLEYFNERQKTLALMSTLPPDEYAVIFARYVEGLEYYEIAERSGKSYSWTKKKHAKGLRLIQAVLDKEESK